jgi:hypothetical protein
MNFVLIDRRIEASVAHISICQIQAVKMIQKMIQNEIYIIYPTYTVFLSSWNEVFARRLLFYRDEMGSTSIESN